MAINKIITLTEEGLNAGPYYDAYYSTDCTNYTLATSSLYLPNVGSTGSIVVADNTICIKLVNLSPNCGENAIIYDFRNTTTTTVPVPPPFTTTTTTQAPGPTTTTTTTIGPLPTTTTYGPSAKVVAHSCQNFYDFNTYAVPASPEPEIGNVYIDSYGTCYYVTSIPSDQTLPSVGNLTFVGAEGACSSSSCVTTTTTAAPYCNQWQVFNNTGAGYYFKYYYCGQTEATYLEVAPNSSVVVCTQNDKIYNSFNAPLTFTNLNTSCTGTTTTTTLPPDLWRVVAHSCQDFYDFNTYGVNKNLTPTININDVLKDDYGTCYYVTSIPSDQTIPVVGILSYVGGSGACSSSACVTTTTTQAPFCNTWKVENLSGFGQFFKYKYCGQTNFLYPEVAANSSVTVCVQNNQIFDSFNTTLVFTNLSQVCNATTTTTTTQGPTVKFTAASCQNIYDFNVYQAASASYSLGDVFKDNFGNCYQILSFNGEVPVGTLTFVGAAGACSSPQCVTTTTTQSPFCKTWRVENLAGAAYYFKYKYCGQTEFTYQEVPAFGTIDVCVQNDQIFNSFGAPLSFDNLETTCIGTTTTTTTIGPKVIFTAAPCENIYNFNVFQANSASYNIGDVFIDNTNTCYSILSFNGEVPVGELTYLAPSGSCGQAPCVTTTTTAAPYCNTWQVTNGTGAGYYVKYKYCGQTEFSYPLVPANSSIFLCVQNDEIYNSFGAPITLVDLNTSCIGTTTTTTTTIAPTTTTTTTRAPYCAIFEVNNGFGAGYNISYVYCGQTSAQFVEIPPFSTRTFCVQNAQISALGNPLSITETTGSCNATTTTTTTTAGPTTTTTTTRAPYCSIWNATNAFDAGYTISYVYCGTTGSTFIQIPANSTRQFCVQSGQISNLGSPILLTETTSSCVSTTTTTAGPTTTTTTTLAPGCWIYVVQNNGAGAAYFDYKNCSSVYNHTLLEGGGTSTSVCVLDADISSSYAPMQITRTDISCAGGTTTTSTTTTIAPTTTTTTLPYVTNQKVIIESCEGPGDITTPIQLAVNGTQLQVGEVVKILGGFVGLDCYTITNKNYTSSVIYYADVEARFADCATCQSGTTTTTQPPTTTTAAPASSYWRAEWCCDPFKSSIIKNDTGLNFQNLVVWNPETNQCMRALETVATQSVSYTYNTSNYSTYTFGTEEIQCNNCLSSSLSDGCPQYGIFAACCDTASTYVVYSTFTEIFTGSYVIYNPIADTCMQYVSATTASTPDLSITSSTYFANVTTYGNQPWSNTNCIADHNCPGVEYPCIATASIYTQYDSAESNTDVSWLQCENDGTYTFQRISYGEGNRIIGCVKSGSIKISSFYADYLTDYSLAYTGGICITGSYYTSSATADFHMFTPSGVPKTFTYDYEQFTGSAALTSTLTKANVHNDVCMNVTSSVDMDKYVSQSIRPSSMPFFCSGSANKAYYIDVTNVYPFNDAGDSVMYFSYINQSGSLVNDSLPYTGSKTIISQVAGFGIQEPKSFSQEGLTWIIRDEFTGSVTSYPYKGVGAQYTATLKKRGYGRSDSNGQITFYYEPGVSSSFVDTFGAVGITSSVVSYQLPMYANISNQSVWNMWLSVDTTTTTTSTTTTSTTTTSTTTTTAGPTTTTTSTTSTTTTAAPSVPTGSYAYYDFGNVSSYPGSGSIVFDLSGNNNSGSLINSPTFSSTYGGELRLNNASSQRIDYSATFTPDTTTVVIWKNVDSTFSKDTGLPTLRGNNGFMAAFLGGTNYFTPILFNNSGGGSTYFSATVTPSDITQWHQYGQVVTYSSPNTTATNYLDGNASSATETKNFDRSGTGTGTAYIGFDNAVSDRYANGYIMAYLHYNRALTTSELNSIYSFFSSRF
jgi:hypothetical protein